MLVTVLLAGVGIWAIGVGLFGSGYDLSFMRRYEAMQAHSNQEHYHTTDFSALSREQVLPTTASQVTGTSDVTFRSV